MTVYMWRTARACAHKSALGIEQATQNRHPRRMVGDLRVQR
jgi:hypothetical protein